MDRQSLEVDDHETAGDEEANTVHHVGRDEDRERVVVPPARDEERAQI